MSLVDGWMYLIDPHTTSSLVVIGSILGLGLYDPLIQFAGQEHRPIVSFGIAVKA